MTAKEDVSSGSSKRQRYGSRSNHGNKIEERSIPPSEGEGGAPESARRAGFPTMSGRVAGAATEDKETADPSSAISRPLSGWQRKGTQAASSGQTGGTGRDGSAQARYEGQTKSETFPPSQTEGPSTPLRAGAAPEYPRRAGLPTKSGQVPAAGTRAEPKSETSHPHKARVGHPKVRV
jgi:hypothetical protein